MDLNDIASSLIAAFNGHDAERLANLYTDDQVTVLPGAPEPVRGRKNKEEMVAGYFRAFPDLTLEIPLVLVSGNHIVCAAHMAGTNTGALVSPLALIFNLLDGSSPCEGPVSSDSGDSWVGVESGSHGRTGVATRKARHGH